VVAQLLAVEMRVPVDDADHKGRTAAHFAVLRDHPAALSALLEAGADVDHPCAAGDTPLHLAASRPHCGEVRGQSPLPAAMHYIHPPPRPPPSPPHLLSPLTPPLRQRPVAAQAKLSPSTHAATQWWKPLSPLPSQSTH
jgi:hypothetical protein